MNTYQKENMRKRSYAQNLYPSELRNTIIWFCEFGHVIHRTDKYQYRIIKLQSLVKLLLKRKVKNWKCDRQGKLIFP